jgi:hypothetical protein
MPGEAFVFSWQVLSYSQEQELIASVAFLAIHLANNCSLLERKNSSSSWAFGK